MLCLYRMPEKTKWKTMLRWTQISAPDGGNSWLRASCNGWLLVMVAGCGFVYFICNHCGASSRSIGYPWHIPRDHLPALNMGDFLYWVARWEAPCASCIIEFNLVTEKLVLMAHPRGSFRDRMDHQNMFVLEMEGQLCFTHVSEISRTIRISVLRDQVRTKRFNVSLEWIAWWLRYDLFPSYYWIKPLGIQGGELILAWHTTGIIKYHLLHRSH
ncbi:hypothetical protein CDL15_Pgr023935 [Punica granatum]|uniref:Uncharacterized protein n=1 Tax=Punica granatum TaxID=22663 RepID=A0A218XWV2_PUNGR|nr:hypothetical protein CDL15_Pgr023935 [Punica granatum]